ncbi:PREDICTED: protein Njmu-R1 [Propithecus coquereli]|uniref:protein Njmu-R1 n=1 Tax=Propithecus coquereli TaxID=379532 RepID=UPI00063F35DC|nr:PREDICTED: protein Njmu-R1 [Propithecus coquereli]
MLPSLQESLDGVEKDLESSEEGGTAEERRLEPPPSSHYCLYSYCGSRLAQQRGDSDDGSPSGTNAETPSGDDFSLSLADTNLPSELEPELRSFIAKRLSKGAVFEGLGNVASVELRIPGYQVGCYYCLFQQEKLLPETATIDSEYNPSEYVVCFLGGSEKGLELFRLELDKYIQGLKNNMNCEDFIFIDLISLKYFVGSNRFCEDWMQAFLNGAEGGNPFLFRQVLENFKLKAIQDTNNLKRFIRQAEMNHYALFKCYMFLKNCGSGDILLKIVKVEHEEMPEAKNVVAVLEEFMKEALTQSF